VSAQAEVVAGKPPFPILVDNTMRGEWIRCPTAWQRAFLLSLASPAPNVHLHAGGAFAKGLEMARRSFHDGGKSVPEAMRDGLGAIIAAYGTFVPAETRQGDKSLDNVIRAYDAYFQRYPLDSDVLQTFRAADGKLMVEFTFAIPTEVHRPWCASCNLPSPTDAGSCVRCNGPLDPILYCGRFDRLATRGDALFVTDEKTATQLGESWAGQWDLESQFTGYHYAARHYGYPVAGCTVRGVGLLKKKITFAETTLHKGQWQLDRWWAQLHKDLKKMVAAYEAWDFDLALAKGSCAAYGGCAYKIMCESPEPDRWLNQYRIRKWDPLAPDHGEKLLDNPALMQEPSDDLVIDLSKLT
jgi:hypothetical protein